MSTMSKKVLSDTGVLNLSTHYIKYPRTYHLPWSEEITSDDRVLKNTKMFEGKEIIVTEKMDGENTSWYNDYVHARSINNSPNKARSYNKNEWAQKGWQIPNGWRVCGENLYELHSIEYNNLPSYFMMFSIWDKNNICLSWDETLDWAELLDIEVVPTIYRGVWDENVIRNIKINTNKSEGYVVRITEEFHYSQFKNSVAKFVRKHHVRTRGLHSRKNIIKNKLRIDKKR